MTNSPDLKKSADERGTAAGTDSFPDAAEHVNVAGSRLPEGSRWCLSLAAMYTIVHRGTDATLEPVSFWKGLLGAEMLRDAWGVDSKSAKGRRAQTLEVIEWLLHQGHRSNPAYASPGDQEAQYDLLAWDLARAVMVARHAFQASYISEDEAWGYLRTASVMAQSGFSSWEEYGRRYLQGRIRWGEGDIRDIEPAVTFLLEDSRSPWRTLDWRMPINETTSYGEPQTLLRSARRGQVSRPAALVLVLTIFGGGAFIIWNVAKPGVPTAAPVQTERTPPSAMAGAAAREAFSRIQVQFYRRSDHLYASFRDLPYTHRVQEFRYGIDSDEPDQEPARSQGDPPDLAGMPSGIKLPLNTRFLTIRARLKDGTLSPVRRFEVHAGR